MKQEWEFLVAFEQKERLVFRNSGFRLVSALPLQRRCFQIFPSLLEKKLSSSANVFQCFASDLSHRENTVVFKSTGTSQQLERCAGSKYGQTDPGLLLSQHQLYLPPFDTPGAAVADSIFMDLPQIQEQTEFSIM